VRLTNSRHGATAGRDPARAATTRGPLSYPDFRILWASTVLAGTGFRAQVVALGWLVLESTDSAFMVGLSVGVSMAPNAVFGLLGGAVVDRFDRRRVLVLGGLAMGGVAVLLGLVALGDTQLLLLLLLTFAGGSVWSVQQTARQSYAFDIVGSETAVRGLSLTNLAQRFGGIAGGLGAGLVLSEAGAAEAYFATAVCFVASGLLITLARSEGDNAPLHRTAVLTNLREYTHEIARNRTLATLILLTAAVEVLGFSHLSALPVLARDELGGGGGTLGLLTAVSAAGGIAGIGLFSFVGDRVSRGVAFLAVLCLFGVSVMLLGASNSVVFAIAALVAVSSLAALSDVLSQTLVQLSVPNEMRGRAMGSWMLAIGTAPAGHLQMGALATGVGVSTALLLNGAGLLILAIATGAGVGRVRRL
jgi:MFS family permease